MVVGRGRGAAGFGVTCPLVFVKADTEGVGVDTNEHPPSIND